VNKDSLFSFLPMILFLIGLGILAYFLFWGPESAYQRDMRLAMEQVKQFQERVDAQHEELNRRMDALDESTAAIRQSVGSIRQTAAAGLGDIKIKLSEIEAGNAKIAAMSDAAVADRVRELVAKYRSAKVQPRGDEGHR
jgi:type II secretory pathway component PulM